MRTCARTVTCLLRTGSLFSLVLLAGLTGCETGGSNRGGGFDYAPRNDRIVAIRHFYAQRPWFHDSDGKVIGFTVRTYFVSGETDKGVFVPGRITVTMNVLERSLEGGFDQTFAHRWTFSEREAASFRYVTDRVALLGDSYGFVLRWPPDLELMGRRIDVQFTYERTDGRIIAGPRRQFQVELPSGFPRPRGRFRSPAEQGDTTQPITGDAEGA